MLRRKSHENGISRRERWRRLKSLFEEAHARPPGERDEFLRNACAADEELRREIRRLLETETRLGGDSFFLRPPPRGPDAPGEARGNEGGKKLER
jgi:hypothetical protein